MYKRWLAVVASLGLLLGAAALFGQVDLAGAQALARKTNFPLIMKGAWPTGTQSSLAVGVSGTLGANGHITYRVSITNRGNRAVTVLPLEFGYNPGSLNFLSSQYTPDQRLPGSLRWNNLAEFPGIGTLAPNATKTLDIVMDPVVCPEGGVISVQALVSGALDATGSLIPPASATVGQKLCASLVVTKTLRDLPTGQALVGDRVTFDIVVTNPAENASAPPNLQTVRGPQVTDRFNPDILSYREALLDVGNGFIPISPTTPITTTPIGSLTFVEALANRTIAPGESLNMRITFEVRSCSSETGTVNIAEVGSPGIGGALVTLARGQAALRIICPNIQVTKRILAPAGGVIALGENITFTIAVKAVGNQAINVIPMQDVFDPLALSFVSSDPQPSGVPIAGTLEWDDLNTSRGTSLQPGETYTVTAVFRAVGCPPGGKTANRARIGNAIASGGGYGFTSPQASDTIEFDIACPRVDVEKRVVVPRSALIQELGGTVTYELLVRNTGNLPLITVPLTDTYDSALFDFVSATTPPTTNAGGTVAWANLAASAPLQPGQSVAVLLTLRTKLCPDPTQPITSVNRTGVSGAVASFRTSTLPVPPDFDEAEVDVVCAQLRISKTLVSPPTGAVSPRVTGRDELTYRIEISNTGNITVTRLPLLDEWDPAYLEYVRADITPDIPGQGTLSWENLAAPERGGPLRPGGRIIFNIVLRAVGCPPDQIVYNKASIVGALAIAGGAGVPTPVPHLYASDYGRVACPRLEITKRLVTAPDCDIVGINQNIDFDITIRNVGNSTIATLPMTDTYEAAYLEFVSATPAPNGPPVLEPGNAQFRTGTLTWTDLTGPAPNGFGRDLPPGESVTVRVTFKTLKSTYDIIRSPNKNTLNRAGITGARDEYNFTAPTVSTPAVPVRIAQANIQIEKTQETRFPETQVNVSTQLTATLPVGYPTFPLTPLLSNDIAVPGELITYTVNYRNLGPDESTYVRITDVIPPGTEYVGHTLASCTGRDIRAGCYIGEIAAGETGQFKVIVRLPRVSEPGFSTPPGTELVNTIRMESGFSLEGPTCGIPDYFNSDNVSSWTSDVVGDFGDAPDVAQAGMPGFGAQVTAAYNGNTLHEWLGRSVSAERGAKDAEDIDGAPNLNPWNYDFHDDGVLYRNPFNLGVPQSQRYYQPAEFAAGTKVIISVANAASSRYANTPTQKLYVDSWADANRNGVFGDDGDKLMFRWSGGPGMTGSDGKLWPSGQTFLILEATDLNIQAPASLGWMMVRTRLSYGALPPMGGALDYGEIEDSLIGVFQGAPPDISNPPGPPQPPARP